MFLLIQTYTALLCDRHLLLAIPEIGGEYQEHIELFYAIFIDKREWSEEYIQRMRGVSASVEQSALVPLQLVML